MGRIDRTMKNKMTKTEKETYIIEQLKYFGKVREMNGYVENSIVTDIITMALWNKKGTNKHGVDILTEEEFKIVNKVYKSMLDKKMIIKSKKGTCTKLII